MLYPVYKNGPFVSFPVSNELGMEWKILKEDEIPKVIKDFEFDVILPEDDKYLCLIDVRKGNNLFLINLIGEIYIHKSIKRPLKIKSTPYELILYRESIETIKVKGRDFIKDVLSNSLFSLLNEKLESGNITLELHTALLKDYKQTIETCLIK